MWVIFLLSSFGFGIVAIGLIWAGNKILNIMQCDDYKAKKKIEDNSNINEKE